jgi:hypothetical protein
MADPEHENPFAVLGVAPTPDAGVVKRAYFAQLAKHPPHTDPAGFQRLRAAYESLQAPGGLAHAFATAPLDVKGELAAWEQRFGAKLAAAQQAARAAAEVAGRLERFLDATARMPLSEAVVVYAVLPPTSH